MKLSILLFIPLVTCLQSRLVPLSDLSANNLPAQKAGDNHLRAVSVCHASVLTRRKAEQLIVSAVKKPAALLQRRSPGVAWMADEVLYMLDSKGARADLAVLEKVIMLGGGASSALIHAGVR